MVGCLNRRWDRRANWCAFTLIELLVVIAVISILAALLMPALRGARNAALDIVCINNLKQVSVAQSQYGDEYDSSIYPAIGSVWDGYATDVDWLPAYLSDAGRTTGEKYFAACRGILHCPRSTDYPSVDCYWTWNAGRGRYDHNVPSGAKVRTGIYVRTPYVTGTAYRWARTVPSPSKLHRMGTLASVSCGAFDVSKGFSRMGLSDYGTGNLDQVMAEEGSPHGFGFNVGYYDGAAMFVRYRFYGENLHATKDSANWLRWSLWDRGDTGPCVYGGSHDPRCKKYPNPHGNQSQSVFNTPWNYWP